MKTDFRGETVRIIGDFAAAKYMPTARGTMAFGAFTDRNGNFFDTTNFPQVFKASFKERSCRNLAFQVLR